jgi:hypothetical protein
MNKSMLAIIAEVIDASRDVTNSSVPKTGSIDRLRNLIAGYDRMVEEAKRAERDRNR